MLVMYVMFDDWMRQGRRSSHYFVISDKLCICLIVILFLRLRDVLEIFWMRFKGLLNFHGLCLGF